MPRRERPLESEDSPLLQFAGDLRRLRRRAGEPTYRELGRRTNYSAAALSEAVAGRRLPSLAVTVAFVRACDGDAGEWTERWRRLADAQPGDTPSPYVGLSAYQVDDADRFFGREALTDTLLALVDERPFAGVFGASGAGKSSLLRAGLAARTQRTPLVVTPGADPMAELAVAIGGLADEPADRVRDDLAADPEALRGWLAKASGDLLLVVDQFEESFTLCDDAARRWLVRALTSAAGPRSRVVVGVRADFYGHCARHPELVAALHRAQLLVGPMSAEEFRWAVTEPATRAGASLETALVARLVADVAGQPAALPLVSHTLAETWRRRRGLVLTLTGYEDVGGIRHALSRTAEQTFDELGEDDRAAARRLFLRLVVPGDGTADTKRRVRRSELDAEDALLDRLAAARLITIDRDSVELAHEALLHAWPRLVGWIDRDRDDLRAQHRISEATAVWEAHDHDPDTLLRGVRLEQAARLRERLNPRERAFLDAGSAAEQARTAAERRVTRRLRRLVAVLAALTVLLAGTAVAAATAQRSATRQRNEAVALRAVDTARGLLAARPQAAQVLALAAHRLAPSDQSRSMLVLAHAAATATTLGGGFATTPGRVAITYDPSAGSRQRLWRPDGDSWLPAAALEIGESFLYAVSADERHALYRSGPTSVLWDLSDPDHPRRTAVPARLPMADTLDRTGSLMSGVSGDHAALLWRTGDQAVRRLPATGVESTALLPDGSGVLLGRFSGGNHTLELWTLDGVRTATLLREPYRMYPSAGPDGLVAVTSEAGEAMVLDARDPSAVRVLARVDGLAHPTLAAFDPAGPAVVLSDPDRIELWDTGSATRLMSVDTQGLDLGIPRPDAGRVAVVGPRGALWQLDSDLPRVIREICAAPVTVDWDRYLPGTTPRQLCSD
ncbi:helix-turn-helix transcriptional regulator [Actinoplanes bogorensis]|uniref:Helix-turn-helix transcriptional regulator n=1 Tax=Paractinoplanes bogorensis TaxID=1610840 RepID=A0ABS5YUW9_9ACTN|nr:helix-turn-helix transcriptional regulator [Actinoplanes bogorensis]MBU2667237.1 helix-turn-helix transcriptional regulator [Actinoplanes bogorensis]